MHRRMLLGTISSGSLTPNLELEGNLSSITTNAQLATFLGVSVNKIRTFTNTGTFIQATLRGNYAVLSGQFYNNTTLTKFRDLGGIVVSAGINSLRNTQLVELVVPKLEITNNASIGYNAVLPIINLPSLRFYGNQALRGNSGTLEIYATNVEEIISIDRNDFAGLTSLNILDLRKLKVYNNPATGYGATASGFAYLKLGCEIRVHIALATANAGAVNESLRYAKNLRGAIVKFYDDNGNYVSTL